MRHVEDPYWEVPRLDRRRLKAGRSAVHKRWLGDLAFPTTLPERIGSFAGTRSHGAREVRHRVEPPEAIASLS